MIIPTKLTVNKQLTSCDAHLSGTRTGRDSGAGNGMAGMAAAIPIWNLV